MDRSGHICWDVMSDSQLMVHNDGALKVPMSFAHVMCSLAQRQGVMNVSLMDYNLEQKVDGDGSACNFRYNVSSKRKINCFLPKEQAFENKESIRASLFGSLWHGHYQLLPNSSVANVLWEATCQVLSPCFPLCKLVS